MSKRAEEAALKAYPHLEQATFDEMYPRLLFTRNTERSAFVQGYELAEKDLGWISVKDRLPEENNWVFVCVDMQGIPQCIGLGYLKNGEWCDDENDNGFCVDYWMPIPKLPKEEEK